MYSNIYLAPWENFLSSEWIKRKKEKSQPHHFTRVCRFVSNKLWWVNLRMHLFFCFKVTFKWKKNCQIARLRQLYSRKYRVQQISAHICDRGGGFDGWKKTTSRFHLSALRVFFFFSQYKVLSVFNLTHFDWLPAHFRKCSGTQLIRGSIRGYFVFQ